MACPTGWVTAETTLVISSSTVAYCPSKYPLATYISSDGVWVCYGAVGITAGRDFTITAQGLGKTTAIPFESYTSTDYGTESKASTTAWHRPTTVTDTQAGVNLVVSPEPTPTGPASSQSSSENISPSVLGIITGIGTIVVIAVVGFCLLDRICLFVRCCLSGGMRRNSRPLPARVTLSSPAAPVIAQPDTDHPITPPAPVHSTERPAEDVTAV